MNITMQQKKNKAIQIMHKLDIYAHISADSGKKIKYAFLNRSADSGLIKSLN